MIDEKLIQELKTNKKTLYFNNNTFLAYPLAGDIIFEDFDSITQTGKNRGYIVIDSEDSNIFYYEDGVYKKNGEQRITEIAQWILGDKTTAHRLAEVVAAVKHINKIRVPINRLNNYPNLVNLNNGIFDIEKNELLSHSKEYLFTTKLKFDYKKDAKCPAIMKFLTEVHTPDDIPLMQELFGYCLYPTYIYHNIFFLIGLGRNGKGTELNLLTAFIGKENVASNSIVELYDDPYALADLFGKLANICGEIGNAPIKTEILKKLSGMDNIRGQHKYEHSFDFTNFAKLIYASNEPPPIYDRSVGIWNRLIFIDFQNTFEGEKCDAHLIDKLITQEELSGLFNWAIEGLQRLKKQGKFSFNSTTEQTMRWYDRKSNPVFSFAQDMLDFIEGEYLLKAEVRRKFHEYCVKYRLREVGDEWFTKKLVDAMPGCEPDRPTIDGRRQQIYLNIQFKGEYKVNKTEPKKPQPQQTLTIGNSLVDHINNLLTDIENHDSNLTKSQLMEDGFTEELINKCIEDKIIFVKPDGKIGVN